jgi:hypothetical protein
LVLSARRRIAWTKRFQKMEICLIAGCAAALIVATCLLWMSRPSLIASGAVLVAGLLYGLIRAAAVRVSPLAAASKADERFQLKDLLVTAWSIRSWPDDPCRRAVLAVAEARCRELSSSALGSPLVNKRGWSVIALAAALVVALGLFSPQPKAYSIAQTLAAVEGQESLSQSPPTADIEIQRARPPGQAPTDEQSQRQIGSDVSTPDGTPGGAADGKNGRSATGDHSAAAAGLGRTSTSTLPMNDLPLAAASHTDQDGHIAGGADGASSGSGAGASWGQTGQSRLVPTVPPWQTSTWPSAQAAAFAALANDRVDPACQDLVRDYFQTH